MAQKEERPQPAAAARRFRRREIKLAEGGKFVLRGDGSITQTDAAGETVGSWDLSDPEWANHAIRFGLQPQPTTVAPQSRREAAPRPNDG